MAFFLMLALVDICSKHYTNVSTGLCPKEVFFFIFKKRTCSPKIRSKTWENDQPKKTKERKLTFSMFFLFFLFPFLIYEQYFIVFICISVD